MSKISVDTIKVGTCFSEPVFFEDGKNMFLPGKHPAEPYHIKVLKRWHIPFLLTNGVELYNVGDSKVVQNYSDVEDVLPV